MKETCVLSAELLHCPTLSSLMQATDISLKILCLPVRPACPESDCCGGSLQTS